jgi:hypothetical protein
MDTGSELEIPQPPAHSRWRLRRDMRKLMREWDQVLMEVQRLRTAGTWSERIAGDRTYEALRSALDGSLEPEMTSPAVQLAGRLRGPAIALAGVLLGWALLPLFETAPILLAGAGAVLSATVVLAGLIFTTAVTFPAEGPSRGVFRFALPAVVLTSLGLSVMAASQNGSAWNGVLVRSLLVLACAQVVISVQVLTRSVPVRSTLRSLERSTRPVGRRALRVLARQRAYAQTYARALEGCFVVVDALPEGPDRRNLLAELLTLSALSTEPASGPDRPPLPPTALLPLARPALAAVRGLSSRHPTLLQRQVRPGHGAHRIDETE